MHNFAHINLGDSLTFPLQRVDPLHPWPGLRPPLGGSAHGTPQKGALKRALRSSYKISSNQSRQVTMASAKKNAFQWRSKICSLLTCILHKAKQLIAQLVFRKGLPG